MASEDQSVRSHSNESDITCKYAEEAILSFLDSRTEPVENLKLVSIAVRRTECDRRDISPAELTIPEVHEYVTAVYLRNLAREGLITYDRVNETVALKASAEEIEQFFGDNDR